MINDFPFFLNALARRFGAVLKAALLLLAVTHLAACAAKTPVTQNTDDSSIHYIEDNDLSDYRHMLADDGIDLSDSELRQFLAHAEIDKNLKPKELDVVMIYFKHYLHKSRATIENNMFRSRYYLDFTKKVFRDYKLPDELAYLAFVESSYNPEAVSRSGAGGLWQFMPATGRGYNLAQNDWVDERFDPYRSTEAAAQYLSKLYQMFGRWDIAIASYNAGEGKMSRAAEAVGTKNFFEIARKNDRIGGSKARLTDETLQYVPRYFAMTKIMRDPQALGFTMARYVPDVITEKAAPVIAEPLTDLSSLAQGLGMTMDDFENYNPHFKYYVTPPSRQSVIYVPESKKHRAAEAMKKENGSGWNVYIAARGDTFARIASKSGVPSAVMRQCNNVREPFKDGTEIRIPRGKRSKLPPSARPYASGRYTVKQGDTFTSIASRHGVSNAELSAMNPQADPDRINVGQVLAVPASGAADKNAKAETDKKPFWSRTPKDAAKPSPQAGAGMNAPADAKHTAAKTQPADPAAHRAAAPDTHAVKKGETMASIASHYGITLHQLIAANPSLGSPVLKAGQVLRLSAGSAGQSASGQGSVQAGSKPDVPAGRQPSASDASADALREIRTSVQGKGTVPQAAVQAPGGKTYTVRPGDTLFSIAKRFGLSLDMLYEINGLNSSSVLKTGTILRISR